jgi:hypothetical protein
MNGAQNKRGTKILIGTVALGFTGALLYFSAWPTLLCTRTAGTAGVDCATSAKAFNLVSVHEARVTGIHSVVMVSSATGSSRTPPRLIFMDAAKSPHDLGYFSQRFAADWMTLDEFVRESDAQQLRLNLRSRERFRTITAHLAASVLILIAGLMIVSALSRG